MNDPESRHPGAETMAAFLDGKLAPGEVNAVAAHLRECADCRTVTGETARFTIEEETRTQRPRTVLAWKGWAAVAAAIAVVVAAPLLRRPPLVASLIDASPREYRRVEGRLSGFPWAPLQGGPRSASAVQTEHELISTAHEVLGKTTNDDAVEARHAAGVANLLIDQTTASLDALANAADESKEARVWNDLAAAHLAVAVRGGREAELPLALAAADRAIQIDSRSAEAHFNRALILQRSGLREQARQAWQRYLEIDPSSDWSNEAREHLRALGDGSSLDFEKQLERARGNREAIAALVRQFPQKARELGEFQLLGEWADTRASERLAHIRVIAEELAATNGELLLLDAVSAIERNPDALAEAHRGHRDALVAYKDRRVEDASKRFEEVGRAFRTARSPMADVAALYIAKSVTDRGGDATELLTSLRARVDATRHRALMASIDWALAVQANRGANWGTALESADRASEAFRKLGEPENAAWTDVIGAMPLERFGAIEPAWKRRIRALSVLTPQRLATTLHSAAAGLAATDQIAPAASLLDVAIATPSNDVTRTDVRIDRARLAERAGDLPAAHRWLSDARAVVQQIADAKIREARIAGIELARGVLQRATDPNAAMAALDRSVAFFEKNQQRFYLSDAFLQRARAHRAAGRVDEARADYRSALQEFDRQRDNVQNVDVKFLDVAAQAIDESIDLHLEHGQIADAFAVSDRAHALATRDYKPAAVPDGVAVIAYAVLPHSVAIFSVTGTRIAAAKVPIERKTLGARVLTFARHLQAREDVLAESQALHTLLIAPALRHIGGARELVIVPDRQLHILPFAALHDGQRYLIQDFELRIAPSLHVGRASARLSDKRRAEARPTSVVVIADPTSDRAKPLPWSRDEAANIAAIHGATILIGQEATRARVAEAIGSSSLVHYAGHADSDAGQSYGALLLASGGGDSGLLFADEIARMDLRARPLVVLSACGTLRGKTNHVAGMPSLSHAFLAAGASAVVGTLWDIDDDTAAPLFLKFHQQLHAGEVPAGALRAAQLAMLQSSEPRLRHPASWSAVEVLSNL